MANVRKAKLFKIKESKSGRFGTSTRTYESEVGTIADLVKYYGYSLEVGQSWEHEKGNRKINRTPKGINSLVSNLYNAKNNAAADGYSGSSFEEIAVTKDEKDLYWAEKALISEI